MMTEAARIMWLYNEMVDWQTAANLAIDPAEARALQAVADQRRADWEQAVDAQGERIARELARCEYNEWEMSAEGGVIDGG